MNLDQVCEIASLASSIERNEATGVPQNDMAVEETLVEIVQKGAQAC